MASKSPLAFMAPAYLAATRLKHTMHLPTPLSR